MADLLVCEGLTKSFGRLLAVDGVSFNIPEGQIKGVAGPNGAGKTTVFNIITGLPYHATSGKVIFAGREIQRTPPHAICHMGIARTFQKETVFETLSVFENVLVAASYGRDHQSRRKGEDKAAEILQFVGLDGLLHESATHLALFEKKKLMLAQEAATRAFSNTLKVSKTVSF